MTEKMHVKLIDNLELVTILAEHLKNGWVFFQSSNLNFMRILEENVYLPPYGKNSDYEVVTGKCKLKNGSFGTAFIQIGKKTLRLKQWLDEKTDEKSSILIWDKLAILSFIEVGDNRYKIEARILDKSIDYREATKDYLRSFGIETL